MLTQISVDAKRYLHNITSKAIIMVMKFEFKLKGCYLGKKSISSFVRNTEVQHCLMILDFFLF